MQVPYILAFGTVNIMIKIRKYVSCSIIFTFLILGILLIPKLENTMYTITTPYNYSLKVGSTEWLSMQPNERVEAYCIPSEIMHNMSTEALLQTIMNNPYLWNVVAFETPELELEYAFHTLSGFDELMKREDLLKVFDDYKENFSKGKLIDDVDDTESILLKINIMQSLIDTKQ